MRAISRLFQQFTQGLGFLGGLGTLVMTFIIVLDVALRTLFNTPISGSNEFSELLLIAMIFLGLAACQQRREHFAIDLATQYLPPAVKRFVLMLGWAASLAVVGLLAWLSVKQAWLSMLRSEASYGTISFPIWPARAVLAFGLVLLSLQFVLDILRAFQPRTDSGAHAPQTSRHE